jgi:hypothetical protein
MTTIAFWDRSSQADDRACVVLPGNHWSRNSHQLALIRGRDFARSQQLDLQQLLRRVSSVVLFVSKLISQPRFALLDLPEHEAEGRLNQIERMIFYSRKQLTKPRAVKQGLFFWGAAHYARPAAASIFSTSATRYSSLR